MRDMKTTSWWWRVGVLACLVAIFYGIWKIGQINFSHLAAGHSPIRTTSNMVKGAEYTLTVYSWKFDFESVAGRIERQLQADGVKPVKRGEGERVWQADGTIIYVARGRQFSEGEIPKPSKEDRNWIILSIASEHPPTVFYRLREQLIKSGIH